jgi:hypothetical protein
MIDTKRFEERETVVPNRVVRRILFYLTVIVWGPAFGFFISGKNHNYLVAGVAGFMGLLCISCMYFTFPRLSCSSCGYRIRNLGAPAHHCMKCGTAYAKSAELTGSDEV